MHPVNHLPFVLGRGSDADFRLDDKGVSRRHLQLSMQGWCGGRLRYGFYQRHVD